MDYKIYKINNGYKVGRKDGQRLCDFYDNRLYITKKPMRREGAKRLLCKLEMAEKGLTMSVKSKKKPFYDGFMRIDPIRSKKKKHHGNPISDIDFKFDNVILSGNQIHWKTLKNIYADGTISEPR